MRALLVGVVVAGAVGCHAARAPSPSPSPAARAIVPELAHVADGRGWRVVNGEAAVVVEQGTPVARLAPIGGNRKGSNVALAVVDGVELAEGTIELDLRGSGADQPSFLGVAFAVADGSDYEAVYFRPFNFRAPDELHRAHAVQYIAWPEHTWERLRNATPGRYEAALDPAPDPAGWFHARVEVGAEHVRVFVGDAATPRLDVARLGVRRRGGVALWVDSQPAAFARLRIAPAK